MWADNETANDLIGFKVHSDLILDVVTDSSLLPSVLGIFGDWGGGKSSIMRMLQKDLDSEKYKDVVCLYFNGWMFEGYEDAKTALLTSILVELGEHKNLAPKLRDQVVGLLKRVKWMELAKLGIKHVGIPLATGALTGGLGAIPAALVPFLPGIVSTLCPTGIEKMSEAEKEDVHSKSGEEKNEDKVNWSNLIAADSGKPDVLEIKKFRKDFDKLLRETDIKSLVILIDDLDRCLPERIIETLEAIKLFAAVSKTAFVIGADPRIVRHAIATRYVKQQLSDQDSTRKEESNLVQDYLEKLIQIPYYLPRLSPAEIETYVNLLHCQQFLGAAECAAVVKDWSERRNRNFYVSYQYGAIRQVIKDATIPDELEGRLAWSNAIAPVITEGLKGNPRQVKRMLNAMMLRQRLAKVAQISIRDEVLAKLMVLEYMQPLLFEELNKWQTQDEGYPEKLKLIEKAALGQTEEPTPGDDDLREWRTPPITKWLQMPPSLREVDLRDYFWLVRDKTGSTLTGLTMVSPFVRRLFDQFLTGNKGEKRSAARASSELEEMERGVLVHLLQQHIERYPDRTEAPEALRILAVEHNMTDAGQSLLAAAKNAPTHELTPSIAYKIREITEVDPNLKEEGLSLLQELAGNEKTKIGQAAKKAMEG